MGCGAAKAVQTEDISSSNGKVVTDNLKSMTNGTNGTAIRRLSKAETRPMTPGYRRQLSKPPIQLPPARAGVLSRARQTLIYSTIFLPKPVAFDIPLDERRKSIDMNSKDVLNVKQPPKRLLSLAEQPSQQLTAEELKDKLLRAEEKRLEILEEKKLKAHKYNEKFSNNHRSQINGIIDDKNLENENNSENNIMNNNKEENKSS